MLDHVAMQTTTRIHSGCVFVAPFQVAEATVLGFHRISSRHPVRDHWRQTCMISIHALTFRGRPTRLGPTILSFGFLRNLLDQQ